MIHKKIEAGSELLQRLALLGVELQALPSRDFETADGYHSLVAEGLAIAEIIHCWQDQLRAGPASTRAIVRQLCDHLGAQKRLVGLDRWLATLLGQSLSAADDSNGWDLLGCPLDPAALSPAELFGFAVALARQGSLSSAALMMAWFLIRSDAGDSMQKGNAEELCSAVIMAALNGAQTADISAPASDYEQWIRDAEFCTQLQRLAECAVTASESMTESVSERLIGFAEQLRTKELRSEGPAQSSILTEIWMGESIRQLRLGNREKSYLLLSQLAEAVPMETPIDVDESAWHQLKINALTQSVPEAPQLTLVESKSLPRAGHHFLKRQIELKNNQRFSYCEQYQEPGCCHRSPCRAEAYWRHARIHGESHIRLVKSHDFKLLDPVYETPPGMVRLIQIRQPFDLLVSWIELFHVHINHELLEQHGISPSRINLYHEPVLLDAAWGLIDEGGCCMTYENAAEWLVAKQTYIVDFLNKWLPACTSLTQGSMAPSHRGTYLIRYEDLSGFETLLQSLGLTAPAQPDKTMVTSFTPHQGDLLQRRSVRITRFIKEIVALLLETESNILAGTAKWKGLMRYTPVAMPE